MADSPSQTIRLGEEQYRWLVDRHPVIQERLRTIRRLLPRLQGRARLTTGVQPGVRSVIEGLSTNQLSSLAIFSTVQTFKQGHPITVRDDEAGGFYTLLSGHLAVGIEGRVTAELSEGDIFGQLGLLEGGTREADVTVVSVDAEVLFVSSRSFENLLRKVPAFGWGIWETVAGRRESIRRRPRERRPEASAWQDAARLAGCLVEAPSDATKQVGPFQQPPTGSPGWSA